MKISLREFIATGKFGPLEPGATRADVVACLGAPPNWSTPAPTFAGAEIWKYGDIEFHFSGDVLWMIFTDDFAVPRGGALIELDAWIISGDLSLPEAKRHLTDAAISYRKEEFPYNENGVRLISGAGTTLSFSGENPARPQLHALSRTLESKS